MIVADVHVEMVADRQKHGLDIGGKIKIKRLGVTLFWLQPLLKPCEKQ